MYYTHAIMSWDRKDLFDPQTLQEDQNLDVYQKAALFHMQMAYDSIELGYINSAYPLAISPDGTLLVSGSQHPSEATFWNVQTGKEVLIIKHTDYIWAICSLAFSSNGKLLALGYSDGCIRIYEAVNREQPLTT